MDNAATSETLPLRLLLVTNGTTIPAWLARSLEELRRWGAVDVAAVLPAPSAARQSKSLLLRLHERIDHRLFRPTPDAFAPVSLRAALPDCSVVSDPAQATQIDVVLDPLGLLAAQRAPRPRYGVWTVASGKSGDPRTQSAPGYWEVVEGTAAIETRLCIRRDQVDGARACYVSVAPADRRSVSRGQNHVFWKVAAALASQLRRLWRNPLSFTRELEKAARFDPARHPESAPGSVAVLRACTGLVARYVTDKWRDARHYEQWALAYQLGREALQYLLPPPDRAWADPFPVRVGRQYHVFHEELSEGKGSIVLTVLDEHGEILEQCVPVLSDEHHLSYPFVFEWQGEWFMIPETAAREQVRLYRCVRFPDQWKLERVLLSGLRAFDATPAFLFGHWWLFATVAPHGVGYMDQLQIFHADSPLGPWTPHCMNPVKNDVRSARPAGRMFERAGHVYRPAQDCSRRYGYAVSINRVHELKPEAFDEVEVERITPRGDAPVMGVHTFNVADNLTVIDVLVRRKKSGSAALQLLDTVAMPQRFSANE